MNNYQWYTEQWENLQERMICCFIVVDGGCFQVGLSWKAAAGKK